jgi:hypothetical protein
MTVESGTIVLAAVPLIAAAGVFVAVRKKSPGGAVFSLVLGMVSLLLFLNLGRDLEEQRRRESIRKSKRKHVEGVFAETPAGSVDPHGIGKSMDSPRPNYETRGNAFGDLSNVAAMERARLNATLGSSALGSANSGNPGSLNAGRIVQPGRRTMPMAPPPPTSSPATPNPSAVAPPR